MKRSLALFALGAVLAAALPAQSSIKTAGSVETDAQLRSNVATGTPPLAVSSRTTVPNLSADLVDGFDGTALSRRLINAETLLIAVQDQVNALGVARLPRSGQTSCYDEDGVVVACGTGIGLGQDGDLQLGVTWPNPRFTDNGDGTVTDNLTGLIWLANASCAATIGSAEARQRTRRQWGKMMKRPTIPAALAAALLGAASLAAPGTRVTSDVLGYSFTAPFGWTSSSQGSLVLLTSRFDRGLIVLDRHEYASIEAILSAPETEELDAGATHLTRVGEIERPSDPSVAARYRGTLEGQPVRAYAVSVIAPAGGGATILAAAPTGIYSRRYEELVREIATSVSFERQHPNTSEPADAGAASDAGPGVLASTVTTPFSGRQLTWMQTSETGYDGTGYRDKEVAHFCADGTLVVVEGGSMSVNAIGGSAHQSGHKVLRGQWSASPQGPGWTLTLTFEGEAVPLSARIGTDEYGDTAFYLSDRAYYATGVANCD